MATMQNIHTSESFRIIHPLDDKPEVKCESKGLGPIEMTPAVKISLKILRGYLVFMSAMLVYHVLDLAGILHKL